MKYFAILKDSLREALDSKILYVLLVLSTLAIVIVALLTFKPLSAEQTMKQFFSWQLTEALNARRPEKMHMGPGMRFHHHSDNQLVQVKLLRGEPDAPESDYELTVSHHSGQHEKPVLVGEPHPDGQGVVLKSAPPTQEDVHAASKAIRQRFADAEELGYIRVGDIARVESDAPGETLLFRVSVQGTPLTHRIWANELGFLLFPMQQGMATGPLAYQVFNLANSVLWLGATVAVLIGVVITSFFIPNMLRKGSVDVLLVKPIHRSALLIYKFFGGLTFVFLSTAYAVGGIWLVLGLRTGLWANGTLLLIFTTTFFFAILYAVSTLVGVVTRSTVTAIMLTILSWFIFFLIGTAYQAFDLIDRSEKLRAEMQHPVPEDERWGNGHIAMSVRIVHAITPRTSDLSSLDSLIVYTDLMSGNVMNASKFDTSKIVWWESLLVSAVWIGIFLGLACLWFMYKDY